MVQELERTRTRSPFPATAPAAYPVFYRTYSRRFEGGRRETWQDVCDRTLAGLVALGTLTEEERELELKQNRWKYGLSPPNRKVSNVMEFLHFCQVRMHFLFPPFP